MNRPTDGHVAVNPVARRPGRSGRTPIAIALAAAMAASSADAGDAATADAGVDGCDGDPGCFLPPGRRTVWNPGLQAVGGIPRRTRTCASLHPSGGEDTSAIQAAVDRCPEGEVVRLAAGDYNLGARGRIRIRRSGVTLRGTVDGSGRPATRFVLAGDHEGTAFEIGEGGPSENFLRQPVALASDAPRGADRITVAGNPGYARGELVTIDQQYDPSVIFLPPSRFGSPGAEAKRNSFCRTNRFVGQVLEVKSVDGDVVTFTTPLHASYPLSREPRLWRHSRYADRDSAITAPVRFSGVEDVYVEGGHWGGAVAFAGAAYCWARNIEVFRWLTTAIRFTRSFRCVYRDSYVHQARDPNPGGAGYALSVDWHSSDNLIENNIHWAANKVIVMRSSGGGNVIAYNYFEDGFGAGYPTIPEVGLNASHYAGSHMELFEGNESWNFGGDDVWGNSLLVTVFRNHLTGVRRNAPGVTTSGATGAPIDFRRDSGGRRMVSIGGGHDWYSFLGNVLGTEDLPRDRPWSYESTTPAGLVPAVWNVGIDGQTPPLGVTQEMCDATRRRTLRHGNFDYVTRKTVWDPGVPGRALPPSLYLTAKPDFFAAAPWPFVDPVRAPRVGVLPARRRFDSLSRSP